MIKEIDTVLFDFDGTLVDTSNIILNSWKHTFNVLEREAPSDEVLMKTFGEPLVTTLEKFFPDVDIEKSLKIYTNYQVDGFGKKTTLFPGMGKLVRELKCRGYKTGLVTSRRKKTTFDGLKWFGLDSWFDAVVTVEDVTEHKPSPQPINICLEELDSIPGKSIMVGDSLFDILCAKNAGVKSVLVNWTLSFDDEDRTGENAPDFCIDIAEELFDCLY